MLEVLGNNPTVFWIAVIGFVGGGIIGALVTWYVARRRRAAGTDTNPAER